MAVTEAEVRKRREGYESSRLGMWIFLATEILLFGGLFCAYAVYRSNHPEIFVYAHRFLSKTLGGINTVVLICSSFTMAWAVRAAQLGERRRLVALLAITIFCGLCFLGIKGIEYQQKWRHGLLWGERYHPVEHEKGGAAETPAAIQMPPASSDPNRSFLPLAAEGPRGLAPESRKPAPVGTDAEPVPKNVQTFFGIYFAMTGLHAVHVIAGMILIGVMLVRAIRREFGPTDFTPVDNVGLYWHLVDVIWIYLFPLLYLIR